MEEGRALFLKGLLHRIRREYVDARRAFEAAALLGSADAYWHMFVNDHREGKCYIPEDEDNLEFHDDYQKRKLRYLKEGAKLGHPLCCIVKWNMNGFKWEDLPTPPSLCAEMVWNVMCSYDSPKRKFTLGERNKLKKEAEQAMLIHDPWPIFCYFKCLLDHYKSLKDVNPSMIAYAIFILEGSERILFDTQDGLGIFWTPTSFKYNSVIKINYFDLPKETLDIICCALGHLAYRFNRVKEYEETPCLEVYEKCKQRSNGAAIAWIGCFKRKALKYISRDTATLIAKKIDSPLDFISF